MDSLGNKSGFRLQLTVLSFFFLGLVEQLTSLLTFSLYITSALPYLKEPLIVS